MDIYRTALLHLPQEQLFGQDALTPRNTGLGRRCEKVQKHIVDQRFPIIPIMPIRDFNVLHGISLIAQNLAKLSIAFFIIELIACAEKNS